MASKWEIVDQTNWFFVELDKSGIEIRKFENHPFSSINSFFGVHIKLNLKFMEDFLIVYSIESGSILG